MACKIATALAALVCLTLVTGLGAAVKFDKVEYMPPKVAGEKQNGNPVKGQISFDKDKKLVVFQDEKSQAVVTIPYAKIKSMLYEKTSKPRYAKAILLSPFFLFTKSKKHFLTIQYTDDAGAGKFSVFHLDKGNARDIINSAEAETVRRSSGPKKDKR
jgi:hypothetical protein